MVVEIKLQYPVDHNGTRYETLKMRRPKVRDQITAQKSGDGKEGFEVALFSNLAEVEPAVIEGMDMKDYKAMQGAYLDFFE